MLSRLALRSVLRQDVQKGMMALMACRSQSTKSEVRKTIENWEAHNKIYFGPERDTKNFPHPVMPETHPPVKMAFIPKSFFDALYDKIGVTGPYVLVLGLVATAFSKEYWVAQHGLAEVGSFWGAVFILYYNYGDKMGAFFDKAVAKFNDARYAQPVQAAKDGANVTVKQAAKEIDSAKCQTYLFESEKENIDLQLEGVYRERLNDVYHDVKRKVDYQIEKQNVKRRFEQTHMVNWIVDNAVKGITPQQEKDSITRCIKDLKSLAAAQ